MRFIHATYNMLHNSIDATTFDGYILRIDCSKAEEGLKTTPCSECALNALAIDKPLEYATLYLEGLLFTANRSQIKEIKNIFPYEALSSCAA